MLQLLAPCAGRVLPVLADQVPWRRQVPPLPAVSSAGQKHPGGDRLFLLPGAAIGESLGYLRVTAGWPEVRVAPPVTLTLCQARTWALINP